MGHWKLNYFVNKNFFRNFDLKNRCKKNFEESNEKKFAYPKILFKKIDLKAI